MIFEDDFKKAISNLPSAEKDKLLIRLLKKDMILANRLYFELVSKDTVEKRRTRMEERIVAEIKRIANHFYGLDILKMEMRDISGQINEHVKITKDKYGEVSLNLFLLNTALELNSFSIAKASWSESYKFCIYVIAKAFRILILIQSLNDNLHIDFAEPLAILGKRISKSDSLMKTAIRNGLDVNWLLNNEIPGNIKEIHRELKEKGLLR